MKFTMGTTEAALEHMHGKARVRVARLWRGREGQPHRVAEWNISISLSSMCLPAFSDGDNCAIVATDSMKNTVYKLAKECNEELLMEDFGVLLGKHFIDTYPKIVTGTRVALAEKPWERIVVDGLPHQHGFKLGSEKHTAEVRVSSDGKVKVFSGISELALLKTTSGFEGYIIDKYTTLPETRERMLASAIRAVWSYSSKPVIYQPMFEAVKEVLLSTFFGPPQSGVYSPSVQNTLYLMAKAVLDTFPEIESVYLNMPNIHFLPVNLPSVGVKFENDIFLPTDEPHGTIEACLTRKGCAAPVQIVRVYHVGWT